MKIVVAMDSFKGSLRASAACEAVRRGILMEAPEAQVLTKPMADGGEGTAEAVIAATGGEWRSKEVTGPLAGMRIEAGYAWLPCGVRIRGDAARSRRDSPDAVEEGPGALIEVSAASGLELLRPHELDPTATTTYGTGELITDAVENGARRLALALGGSATVDGGVGAAMALGWRFLDGRRRGVGLGGGALERIASIEPPEAGEGGSLPPLDVLCDVDNPLLGERGAARVFGPQKGADPATVEHLERGLARLAVLFERELGVDVRGARGGGAAGGLGAGALALFGGTLLRGVDAVIEAVGLEEALDRADWAITGEGRFDEQSLDGKVVSGVIALARRKRARVAVIAGSSRLPPGEAHRRGVSALEVLAPDDAGQEAVEDAIERAEALLVEAGRRFAAERLRLSS